MGEKKKTTLYYIFILLLFFFYPVEYLHNLSLIILWLLFQTHISTTFFKKIIKRTIYDSVIEVIFYIYSSRIIIFCNKSLLVDLRNAIFQDYVVLVSFLQ